MLRPHSSFFDNLLGLICCFAIGPVYAAGRYGSSDDMALKHKSKDNRIGITALHSNPTGV